MNTGIWFHLARWSNGGGEAAGHLSSAARFVVPVSPLLAFTQEPRGTFPDPPHSCPEAHPPRSRPDTTLSPPKKKKQLPRLSKGTRQESQLYHTLLIFFISRITLVAAKIHRSPSAHPCNIASAPIEHPASLPAVRTASPFSISSDHEPSPRARILPSAP